MTKDEIALRVVESMRIKTLKHVPVKISHAYKLPTILIDTENKGQYLPFIECSDDEEALLYLEMTLAIIFDWQDVIADNIKVCHSIAQMMRENPRIKIDPMNVPDRMIVAAVDDHENEEPLPKQEPSKINTGKSVKTIKSEINLKKRLSRQSKGGHIEQSQAQKENLKNLLESI